MQTGAFDSVWIWGLPEDYGSAASGLAAAAIEPSSSDQTDRWDDASDGSLLVTSLVTITLLIRHEDPQLRDEAVELLFDTAADALNGQSLAGLTLPSLTRFLSWRWEKPAAPERRITAIFLVSIYRRRLDLVRPHSLVKFVRCRWSVARCSAPDHATRAERHQPFLQLTTDHGPRITQMSATKAQINWASVTFGSTAITRVTTGGFGQGGKLLRFKGDTDLYSTVIANVNNEPTPRSRRPTSGPSWESPPARPTR